MNDNSRSLGQYLAAAPALPNGALGPLRVDSDSVLLVRDTSGGGGITWNQTNDPADNFRVLTAAESHLLSIVGFNLSAFVRYLHIFDVAFLPANGTAPNYTPIEVLPLSNFALTCEPTSAGFHFIAGITWAVSSTAGTLTSVGTPDFFTTSVWRNG